MSEFPDTELSRRVRANWGRRWRPEFARHFQAAVGYAPEEADFADVQETDRLRKGLRPRVQGVEPSLTWPEAQQKDVFAHLLELAKRLGTQHCSYLMLFARWEYIGALRVRSYDVLVSAQELWQKDREDLCLLTADLGDGLFLGHTEPKQMYGADDDEYELYIWERSPKGMNP